MYSRGGKTKKEQKKTKNNMILNGRVVVYLPVLFNWLSYNLPKEGIY